MLLSPVRKGAAWLRRKFNQRIAGTPEEYLNDLLRQHGLEGRVGVSCRDTDRWISWKLYRILEPGEEDTPLPQKLIERMRFVGTRLEAQAKDCLQRMGVNSIVMFTLTISLTGIPRASVEPSPRESLAQFFFSEFVIYTSP